MRLGDVRTMCGTDIRRYGVAPDDAMRAEAMTAKHGGDVELFGTEAGCAVRWTMGDLSVTAYGVTYGDALAHLDRSMT